MASHSRLGSLGIDTNSQPGSPIVFENVSVSAIDTCHVRDDCGKGELRIEVLVEGRLGARADVVAHEREEARRRDQALIRRA